MLEVRGLQAFYGPAQALFGINLEVRAGEMVVLQGLNGAGKSTLLKSLMGLEVRTRGSVRWQAPGAAAQAADGAALAEKDRHGAAAAVAEEGGDGLLLGEGG